MITWSARILGALLFVAGLGLMFPVWWPSPTTTSPHGGPGMSRAIDRPLSGWDDPRMRRAPGEADLEFATRAMREVHEATYHCNANQSSQTLAAHLAAEAVAETASYGYLAPDIMRCGFCHQRAFLLAEFLRRGGISNAQTYALQGHVLTLAQIDGQYFMLDPDYGVGPILYHGPTYAAVPDDHYAAVVDPRTLEVLREPFSRADDDVPYMTHDWLLATAAQQANAVREVELQLTRLGAVIGMVGIVFFLLPGQLRGRRP